MPLVELAVWMEADFSVLERCNTPDQKRHIGGSESPEKLRARHEGYVRDVLPGTNCMLAVRCTGTSVGSIGYWERTWRGQTVYETGWAIVPEFQDRGFAGAAATLLIQNLRPVARHRFLHAFPSPGNGPSNAICRRIGFAFMGECEFEYPPGRMMRCNDWRYDLQAALR